jgi:hypothetical protein
MITDTPEVISSPVGLVPTNVLVVVDGPTYGLSAIQYRSPFTRFADYAAASLSFTQTATGRSAAVPDNRKAAITPSLAS